jgi:site-specific recombinase XerC
MGLKPKTQEGYRSLVNHHLLPRLANTPVARVDLAMVSSVLSEISRSGAGSGTVGNIRGVLNLVLEQARLSGAIRANPVRDTKAPKKPHQEMVFLTPDEIIVVSDEIAFPPTKKRPAPTAVLPRTGPSGPPRRFHRTARR